MWNEKYNEELYHYGVLGMKWGVRRGAKKQFRSDVKTARLNRKKGVVDLKKAGQKNPESMKKVKELYKTDIDAARKKYRDTMSSKAAKTEKAVKTALGILGGTAVVAYSSIKLGNAANSVGVSMKSGVKEFGSLVSMGFDAFRVV